MKSKDTRCSPTSPRLPQNCWRLGGVNLHSQCITSRYLGPRVRTDRRLILSADSDYCLFLADSTVIPSRVKAHVSVRIVPDQDLETIVSALKTHLQTQFEKIQSPNRLEVSTRYDCDYQRQCNRHIQVTIEHMADWWLGNLDDRWFHALEDAVRDEWEIEPLRIREGGVSHGIFVWFKTKPVLIPLQSIPSIPYLEKEFACHALHLPMGQSTVCVQLKHLHACISSHAATIGSSTFTERAHIVDQSSSWKARC